VSSIPEVQGDNTNHPDTHGREVRALFLDKILGSSVNVEFTFQAERSEKSEKSKEN
jgi:hypothetical protein